MPFGILFAAGLLVFLLSLMVGAIELMVFGFTMLYWTMVCTGALGVGVTWLSTRVIDGRITLE